ncbi:aminopeptidase P family protein [Lachnoclostridium sp. Marseille-P6806]|uniref:aminopeptidase P family protein n=1 Tax=Lachnoclostridium sp. Marseille-P6806 TaxID=2364793 RepID=UPI0010322F7B|nr:aminopeptidase P family protein [Lachnoclostridium sp. Marseille-P6806]
MNTHIERLDALRARMREQGVHYYMIPTSDFHNSEYSADYFKEREFFSNFSGSNGTLVVGADGWAGLWTDGRYWIQAENEMRGNGIELFKMQEPGVPTIPEYLRQNMKRGEVLGFDGRCISKQEGTSLAELLAQAGASVCGERDLGDAVWTDRPALPCHPMFRLGDEQAGESFSHKLARLREKMEEKGCRYYVASRLDDLMWITNFRGNDVEYNPVALSYGFFSDKEAHLFVQEAELTEEIRSAAEESGLALHPYESFADFLKTYRYQGRVLLDPASVSYTLYLALCEGLGDKDAVTEADSPIEWMKAVKNRTEQKNIRDIYREDSAAVCRFIYWLTQEADIEALTELDAAEHMDGLRRQIPDFIELSFGTISAYGPNAAMMHYEPSEGHCARLERKGMLLIDCGGTYLRGTTDVTRTMALGPVTEDMKRSYTLTAAGNLALLNAVFMEGCTGRNLDILAREPLWRTGSDYKCGTGHGIGYVLNVHEGPQNIRWRASKGPDTVALVPGMVVSDEPGVYREGEYGIRIETILLCTEDRKTSDGRFYRFDPLTFVPLDRSLIDPRYLSDRELSWLNGYHRRCREEMSRYLSGAELAWLNAATEEIRPVVIPDGSVL